MILGISITSTSQIIPAITLAKLVKNENENIIVVLGGNVLSRLHKNVLMKFLHFFNFIDAIIVFEGEDSLYKFIEYYPKQRYDLLTNLIFKDKNRKIRTKLSLSMIHNLDLLPFPDFSDLPLDKYLSPCLILPTYSSRGCYWGKCAFCAHGYIYKNNYREINRESY